MNTNNPVSPPVADRRMGGRKLVLILIVAAVVGGGYLLWSGGYIVDIARFFAAEPAGYVPIVQRPGLLIAECGDQNTLSIKGPTQLRYTHHPEATGYSLQRGNEGPKTLQECGDYWCFLPDRDFPHEVPTTEKFGRFEDHGITGGTCYEYRVKYGTTLTSNSVHCPVGCYEWPVPGNIEITVRYDQVIIPRNSLEIFWRAAPDVIRDDSGQLRKWDIRLQQESLGPQGFGYIERGVLPRGAANEFNPWNMSYVWLNLMDPILAEDGTTQLQVRPDDRYSINIRAADDPGISASTPLFSFQVSTPPAQFP